MPARSAAWLGLGLVRRIAGPSAIALAATVATPALAPAAAPRVAAEPRFERLEPAPRTVAWARDVAPVEVVSLATGARAAIRLYDAGGDVDPAAVAAFERVAWGGGDGPPIAPRLVQLVVAAAYRFSSLRVLVVSGWRPRAGRHTSGEALDFKLDGVPAGALAASLRAVARAGVGIYTHPKTQYVHLDVRDASFHWIDGSPPGVTWRERMIRDPDQAERDAAWAPEADLP